MRISVEQLRFVRKNFGNLPRILAEHAFFFTLFLMALAVVISLAAFLLATASLRERPETPPMGSEFKAEMFEGVFDQWEAREAHFASPSTPNTPNIF